MMRKFPRREQVDDDVDAQQGATNADREVAQQWLGALVKLIGDLESAFHGHDPQEVERPIAGRQIRYMRAMRAIGDLLKSAGRPDLQSPLYKLAEALNDHVEGRPHWLLGIDASVKPGKGSPPDTHDLWRLRATLCAGILWLEAAGLNRHGEGGAILEAVRVSRTKPQLSKLKRREADSLEGAIKEWLKRFENPAQEDDFVAVSVFQVEKEKIEARRAGMSVTQLKDKGLAIINGVAGSASELLNRKKKDQ
jgi:hypothetical protein